MRICFLSKMFPPIMGGSAMYAYEMANALGARGHDVDVYTQRTDENTALRVNSNVTVTHLCKERRYLVTFETANYSIRARRAVDFDDYDIVHGTLMPASTIALPSLTETAVVLTSHSFALSEMRSHSDERLPDFLLKYFFHPMNAVFDCAASHRADQVIAISSEMREQLVSTYRLSEDEVSLITHGVDTDTFYPRDAVHPAVTEEKTTALFVGRLITRKGADTAIETVARTTKDVELLVAGTGRDEERLRRLTRKHGVDDRVRFLGYVPDDELPVLYSSADVQLFTSDYEGFGLVFLEAMACGTPVIGTPVGGIPDVVEDGETGYIVERDPRQLSERIDELATDLELLERLSQNALETARSMTWDDVAEQVERVYESIT